MVKVTDPLLHFIQLLVCEDHSIKIYRCVKGDIALLHTDKFDIGLFSYQLLSY